MTEIFIRTGNTDLIQVSYSTCELKLDPNYPYFSEYTGGLFNFINSSDAKIN